MTWSTEITVLSVVLERRTLQQTNKPTCSKDLTRARSRSRHTEKVLRFSDFEWLPPSQASSFKLQSNSPSFPFLLPLPLVLLSPNWLTHHPLHYNTSTYQPNYCTQILKEESGHITPVVLLHTSGSLSNLYSRKFSVRNFTCIFDRGEAWIRNLAFRDLTSRKSINSLLSGFETRNKGNVWSACLQNKIFGPTVSENHLCYQRTSYCQNCWCGCLLSFLACFLLVLTSQSSLPQRYSTHILARHSNNHSESTIVRRMNMERNA